MDERFDPGRRDGRASWTHTHVHALRAAYRDGRLVVSADSADLARARTEDGHAIDARDVADAMLRKLLPPAPKRPG